MHLAAELCECLPTGLLLSLVCKSEEIHGVPGTEEAQLLVSPDLLALVRGKRYAMGEKEYVHGNHRTTCGPSRVVSPSGSLLQMRLARSNLGFNGVKFGTLF